MHNSARRKENALEIQEFERLLAIGHGRAVVHLMENDPAPCRESILYACLHDLRFDHDFEREREPYLWSLIQFSGDPNIFRDTLLNGLRTPREDEDQYQIFDLAALFAAEGDDEVRSILYDIFTAAADTNDSYSPTSLIKLDGANGLAYAINVLSKANAIRDSEEVAYWVGELEDRDGKAKAWEALESAAAKWPGLSEWMDKVRAVQEGWKKNRERLRKRPAFSYDDLLREIQSTPKASRTLGWGKWASDEDILRAANDLIAERDHDRLLAYLKIFRFRRFPLEPDRLIELANNANERIAGFAVAALAHDTHGAIRELALDLAKKPDRRDDAVDLLVNNFQDGDYALVDRLTHEPSIDRDHLHRLGISVKEFVDKHLDDRCVDMLTFLYEQGPCSMCRHGFVGGLMRLDRLPERVREECLYDADDGVRELALHGLTE